MYTNNPEIQHYGVSQKGSYIDGRRVLYNLTSVLVLHTPNVCTKFAFQGVSRQKAEKGRKSKKIGFIIPIDDVGPRK